MQRPSLGRIAWVYAAGIAALVLMTLFDWVTGPDIRSELFYVMPVLLAAYMLSRRHVVAMSLIATLAFVLSGMLIVGDQHPGLHAFQAVGGLIEFLIVGLALSAARRERDSLRDANARISELLDQETRLARTDALTGLANLREFMERLRLDTARASRDGTPICVAYFDLDNFKRVNDLHGHASGDQALTRFASTLKAQVRAADLPARIGGDEFAVLLWGADIDAARAVARRMVDAATEIGQAWPDTNFGASSGVAWFGQCPQDPEQILRAADEAMYEAKSQGKGKIVLRQAAVQRVGSA